MQVSYRWLCELVPYEGSLEDFTEAMSLSGTKVENIIEAYAEIQAVEVGKIIEIKPHPDADRLRICQVEMADGHLQIVTAASNIEVGQKVPVARDKAKLAGDLKIKKTKMRGEVSEGMFCSFQELGLEQVDLPEAPTDGILILPADAPLGADVMDYLGFRDHYVEFEITPNRADCLSIAGIAREFAATFKLPFDESRLLSGLPELELASKIIEPNVTDYVEDKDFTLKIENLEDCSNYLGQVFKIKNLGASPRWLRQRLRGSGIRPINNLVDISNYVMLLSGNPMHCFDFGKFPGKDIVIRRAKSGETIKTLDDLERKLINEDLLITAGGEPIALAGVMGGAATEITEDSRYLFLEIGKFKPDLIRKTAARLALHTDASLRFARDIPAKLITDCHLLFNYLVCSLGVAEPIADPLLIGAAFTPVKNLKLNLSRINDLLGLNLSKAEAIEILKPLGINEEQGKLNLPYWRNDLERDCDIAEELARFYGYNKIASRLQVGGISSELGMSLRDRREAKMRSILLGAGGYECMSSPFASASDLEDIEFTDFSKAVKIRNPLGKEREYLAPSLLPRLLEHVALNQRQKAEEIFFFEFAKSFEASNNTLPFEHDSLSIIFYKLDLAGGDAFFKVKGVLEEIFRRLKYSDLRFEAIEKSIFQTGQAAEFFLDEQIIGQIGRVHPELLDKKEVKGAVVFAELNLDSFIEACEVEFSFKKPSKYPAVERDLAIVAPREMSQARIREIIVSNAGKRLHSVKLFDHYEGESLGKDKKSLAYELVFRSDHGTLEDKDIDKAIERIISALEAVDLHLRA